MSSIERMIRARMKVDLEEEDIQEMLDLIGAMEDEAHDRGYQDGMEQCLRIVDDAMQSIRDARK